MKLDDRSLMYDDGSLKIDDESMCFGSVHKFILDTIYVRNTKQSVGTQYSVPEVSLLFYIERTENYLSSVQTA